MPMPTEGDYKLVNKNQDDAIAELVDAIVGREAPRAPYGELVYKAAWKLAKACQAFEAVYDYRLTDIEEYNAEVERRRQIGLTIDPASAETTFSYRDVCDPYDILDLKYHAGGIGRERFARNPSGEWVCFGDLPEATCKALWERDGRKLAFPYGLNPDDDVINHPPAVEDDLDAS